MSVDFDDVLRAVKRWKPDQEYKKETEYSKDIEAYLRDKLNDEYWGTSARISCENGRGLCDVTVNEKLAGIELKKDLNSKAKIDRLVGQVHRYTKEYKGVIIVLVGKTKANSLDDLKTQLKSFSYDWDSEEILVVDKGNGKTKEE